MRSLFSCLLIVSALAAWQTAADDANEPPENVLHVDQVSCIPERTARDAERPFCFVPNTVSNEARQFLATKSAGASRLGKLFQSDAGVAAVRDHVRQMSEGPSKAAVEHHLQSTRNASIAGVPVAYGIPKSTDEKAQSNKIIISLHGMELAPAGMQLPRLLQLDVQQLVVQQHVGQQLVVQQPSLRC